ncbi:MAG TPA: FecR family protein [Polyangia bacterium]|nr:FecR family protein [Polyangia bacterium]
MTPVDLHCSIHADRATQAIVAGQELPAPFAVCPECAGQLRALRGLRDLGAALDWTAPDTERSSRMRARLLRTMATAPVAVPRRSLPRIGAAWAMAAASCAAGILAIATVHRGKVERAGVSSGEALLGAVHEVGAAQFGLIRKAPDEVVRLVEGRLHVEVSHLGPAERFRIVTDDAVVEVRGTAFDVRAANARLQEVAVERGRVEVRVGTSPPRALEEGGRWTAGEAAAMPPAGSTPAPTPVRATHPARERAHREEDVPTSEPAAVATAPGSAEAARPSVLPAAVEVGAPVPAPPPRGAAVAESTGKPTAAAPAAATARVDSEPARRDRQEQRMERRELREERRLERLDRRR